MSLAGERLAATLDAVATAERAAGREPGSTRVVAVSKRMPVAALRAVAEAGHRDFGENYIAEAEEKIAALGDLDLRWHMVGRVQSNKAARAAKAFALIHGLDSLRTARGLARAAAAAGTTAHALVQIRLGGGSGRAGVDPALAEETVTQMAAFDGLSLDGVMGVADPDQPARPQFARLRQILERLAGLGLPRAPMTELSAGMSGDYAQAVAEGATVVRIGTAIFGERP